MARLVLIGYDDGVDDADYLRVGCFFRCWWGTSADGFLKDAELGCVYVEYA
jgi:hypothetical protein